MEFSDLTTGDKLMVIGICGAFWFFIGFIVGKITAAITAAIFDRG